MFYSERRAGVIRGVKCYLLGPRYMRCIPTINYINYIGSCKLVNWLGR